MARKVTVRPESFPLARPFAISRGVKTAADVVVVEITDGDIFGHAECVPYPRYDETVDGVIAEISEIITDIEAGAGREVINSRMSAGAARNAVDCALWDFEAKASGTTVADLAGFGALKPEITAETIGIGTADEMGARAADLKSAPLLKIKLDANDVQGRLDAIRQNAPNARLIIDPNEGWTVDFIAEYGTYLADIGVEMLEQPVPAGQDAGLKNLDCPVPICADESLHTSADLPALKDLYGMVNIKLDKTGGLTEALNLQRQAVDMGFQIMVGCMVGSSLAMAPAVLVAQGAKIVDLDGPLLLKQDRDNGIDFTDGLIRPASPALWG